jgi:hypothetical protein
MALELVDLVHVRPHLWAIVLLHHLVDHQLRVTVDHQALDAEACHCRRPETKPLYFAVLLVDCPLQKSICTTYLRCFPDM